MEKDAYRLLRPLQPGLDAVLLWRQPRAAFPEWELWQGEALIGTLRLRRGQVRKAFFRLEDGAWDFSYPDFFRRSGVIIPACGGRPALDFSRKGLRPPVRVKSPEEAPLIWRPLDHSCVGWGFFDPVGRVVLTCWRGLPRLRLEDLLRRQAHGRLSPAAAPRGDLGLLAGLAGFLMLPWR